MFWSLTKGGTKTWRTCKEVNELFQPRTNEHPVTVWGRLFAFQLVRNPLPPLVSSQILERHFWRSVVSPWTVTPRDDKRAGLTLKAAINVSVACNTTGYFAKSVLERVFGRIKVAWFLHRRGSRHALDAPSPSTLSCSDPNQSGYKPQVRRQALDILGRLSHSLGL